MQHIIRKQTLQISLQKSRDSFHIQHLISEHFWKDILPIMERSFNEASSENETLYIDTLEIDLGILTEKEIRKSVLSDETLTNLGKQLREKLRLAGLQPRNRTRLSDTVVNCCQQWFFYMKNGYLPWNILKIDEGWLQKVLEALAVDHASILALKKLILTDFNVVDRIVNQHTEEFLIQFVGIISADRKRNLSLYLDELEILFQNILKTKGTSIVLHQGKTRKTFWKDIIKASALYSGKTDEKDIIRPLLEKYLIDPKEIIANEPDLVSKVRLLYPIIKSISEQHFKPENRSVHQLIKKDEIFEKEIPDTNEQLIRKDGGIFLKYAGLVLLHPFLRTLFDTIGLLKDGKFVSEDANHRALYLLYYLASGKSEAEEHELTMPKILCDCRIQDVVEILHLTEDEMDEADHLLEVVIQQWKALKSTPISGLREGFLIRGGFLNTRNDKIFIQVEPNPIDVLLDQLPWNLSIIKLPWMKSLLNVEWR